MKYFKGCVLDKGVSIQFPVLPIVRLEQYLYSHSSDCGSNKGYWIELVQLRSYRVVYNHSTCMYKFN